jgi:hypothetical protein
MVEFIDQVRKRCRKCKSKLPVPTSNDREGFCCRGCYDQFYRKHCRICERSFAELDEARKSISQRKTSRKPGHRITCPKLSCKSAWKKGDGLGCYSTRKSLPATQVADASNSSSESAAPQGVAQAIWRQVAGPQLSADAFHAATVPDGPNCDWSGGSYRRYEDRNKAELRERFKATPAPHGSVPIGRPFRGLPRIAETGELMGHWWTPELRP